MLIVKYFVIVGAVLTAGLFALSAYLGASNQGATASALHPPTTTSLPVVAAPPPQPVDLSFAEPPPAKPAKGAKSSRHRGRR